MSLFRTFKITEGLRMEFRAEAFNLTNTPHFNAPDPMSAAITSARSSALMTGTGPAQALAPANSVSVCA